YLNFSALVIGSMAPDFGYFADQFEFAKEAHTLTGLITDCLPASLILLGLFYLLRWPLCFILPQPHRSALAPLAARKPKPSFRGLLVAVTSILIGGWTHIVWDSFTHWYGWPVQHFVMLRRIVTVFHGTVITTFFLLQLLSSVIGALGLLVLYVLWLRRQPQRTSNSADTDGWRYALLATVISTSIAIAVAAARHHTAPFMNGGTIEELLYWTAVYSISVFFPVIALAAAAVYLVNPNARARPAS
ncbi:MAG TPA: DUF4184 family protein, partial [Lacipirellulaceae bacterium]|nr:DUF4184 family protein [Lacipirellulaceae bacterium]